MRGNKNALFNGRMEIHNYQRRLEYWQKRIGKEKHADKALAFISHLKTKGLSDGRVCAYASRVPKLQRTLAEMSLEPRKIDSIKAEKVLAELLKDWMKGSTKQQYAPLLKKFVNYVKTGNSDKNCHAVAWIKPSRYNKGRAVTVEAADLLSEEEILALLSAVASVSKNIERDRAMLWTLLECALRPGELLTMRVGDVKFKDKYCLISVRGKTGLKNGVIVLGYKAVLEWLNKHPQNDDPEAPLWYNMSSNHQGEAVGYSYLSRLVKRSAQKASIKKRIWNYLFRHTQLTRVATRLREANLNSFAGWTQGSSMARKYVHLSGADLENSVLEMHGLTNPEEKRNKISISRCPRCSHENSPEVRMCTRCGLVLDEQLAIKLNMDEQDLMNSISKRIENMEQTVSRWLASSS